jgi:hypothetical protein
MRMGKFVKNFQIPMSSKEYNYKYDGKYFVFERCVIFANLLHGGESYCYESHFWVKGEIAKLLKSSQSSKFL